MISTILSVLHSPPLMQIEALSAENRQLTMRLENALGKLEVVCYTDSILDMLLSTLFSKLQCVILFPRTFAKQCVWQSMVSVKCCEWGLLIMLRLSNYVDASTKVCHCDLGSFQA